MKKHLLSSALVLTTMASVFSQSIPNGGFENWNTVSFENPTYYFSSNMQNNGSSGPGPVNVIKTSDSFSNSYAVQMTTVLSGNDTATAYVANGDPGNPMGQGIPYNQQATGIQFRYKSNIMSGDTGLVIVMFRKSGSTIGMYLKKITGSQTTYSLGTMSFSLPQAPDTVIFAATPSNALSGFSGIPGSMLQLDSVLFTGVATQPVNFNGDFELWQQQVGNYPVGWNVNSSNSLTSFRTTDFYSGTYALELETQTYSWGTYGEGATTGTPTQSTTIGGYPFSNQTDTLIFYYKYAPGDVNDSASWSLGFKNNGTYFNYIGGLLAASPVYKQVKVTINLGMAPDTMVVFLNSSKTWSLSPSYAGAIFKVDNMYLTSQMTPVTGILSPTAACVSQTVQLNDNSSNLPTSWTWTLTGATTPTSNAQNPIVTYTAPGTYTITHDASNANGNGTVVTKTISVNALPSISISGSNTVCAGSSTTLTASGAANYMWNTGFSNPAIIVSPSVTTSYTVTGTTAQGCSNTSIETVTVSPLPSIMASTSNSIICGPPFQGTATLTASGGVNYMWNPGGAGSSIVVSPSVTSTYTVNGTDANGCSNIAMITQTVSTCTGINQMEGLSTMVIYPNPGNGQINIKSNSDDLIIITNELGQMIKMIELNSANNYTSEVNIEVSGVYVASGKYNKYKIIVLDK